MSRDFFTVVARIAKNAARENERQRRENDRSYQRRLREIAKQKISVQRQQAKDYYESRLLDVQKINQDLECDKNELASILVSALGRDLAISFNSLMIKEDEIDGVYDERINKCLALKYKKPEYYQPKWFFIINIFLWIPFLRDWLESILVNSKKSFQGELRVWNNNEVKILEKIKHINAEKSSEIEAEKRRVEDHNKQIREWEQRYESGDPVAISEYYDLILSGSPYPKNFPKEIKVSYSSSSRLLVVEVDLPEADQVIPKEKSFKYVKANDAIVSTNITDKAYRESYKNVISQIALRTIYEIFFGAKNKYVDVVALNCKIKTIDPSTGRKINPCLITLRVSFDAVSNIDFNYVDPALCLKELKAIVSSSPSELLPVRPVVDFDMNDPRFVAETDILSGLDSRQNLMDLSPSEFESLITNLFQAMGLETRLTQASRDGGVDCIAYDSKPVLGGKFVIQAKRYKDTVGVSAVRDLYGTLQNEGASKGILVTTSGYGKASYDFARGKPIDLFDGSQLLSLLKEYAGIDAKIIIPPRD